MSEAAPAPLLRCREVRRAYGTGAARVEVLRGLDLEVAAGEMVAILGESGAGKTTLLHVVGALDRPDAGTIEVRGRDIAAAPAAARAAYRNRDLGFVFQFHHLLPEFSAVENAMMPLLIGGEPQAAARARAAAILGELGLSGALDRRPAELSGGEQQRVAIARAIIRNPVLLLADEPTGNLDERNAASAFELLRDLHRARRMTTILVTHSERLAARSDRVLVMQRGSLTPVPGGR
ncbi:MAG TPA: ABC transporter ATP-binding protein [Candidatus Polarisedimenticolia bacterium]|jgi:lipoprotein-releasing system ATP-binding protein|nr:ABC transporter ATP-binding protein [Candidatus Polarisedimenticolia bacterium]